MKQTALLFALLALFSLSFVSADAGDFDCGIFGSMGGMMSGNYGFGMGIFSWLIGLLITVALVLLIIWLIKQIGKDNKR